MFPYRTEREATEPSSIPGEQPQDWPEQAAPRGHKSTDDGEEAWQAVATLQGCGDLAAEARVSVFVFSSC